MPYTKQTWANGLAGGTPLSAARLNYIEDGIEAAFLEGGAAGLAAITVAPSDASAEVQASADYVCDGTGDDVTIETALADAAVVIDLVDTFTHADGAISAFSGLFGGVQNASWNTNKVAPTATDSTTLMLLTYYSQPCAPGESVEVDVTWNSGMAGVVWAGVDSYGAAGCQGVYAYVDGTNVKLVHAPNNNSPASQTPIATAAATLVSGNTYRLGISRSLANLWVVTIDAVVKISTTYDPGSLITFGNEYRGFFSKDSAGNNRFDNFALPQLGDGGEIHLLPGNFYFANPVDVTYPATIVGSSGSYVHLTSLPAGSCGFTVTARSVTIKNLVFAGGAMASAVAGIRVQSGSYSNRIDGCRFKTFTDRVCIELFAENNDVTNCYFEDARAGVFMQYTWNHLVSGNTFNRCYKGVHMNAALAVAVIGNHFVQGDNLVFADDPNGYNDSGEHLISGNVMYYPVLAGVHMEYQFNPTITGNSIQEGGDFGIRLYQCSNGVISGNNISFFLQDGVLLQGCDDILVAGNSVSETNGAGAGSAACIRVANSAGATPVTSSRVAVLNNMLRVASPLTGNEWYGNVPRYGVRIETSVADTIVYGNDVRGGDFVIPIYDSGTGTVTTNASGNWT